MFITRIVLEEIHSRIVVVLRAGVVLNAKRYAYGGRVTRVWLSQNSELRIGQRDMRVRKIAVADILIVDRAPVSAGDGGDSPLVEGGA